MTPEHRVRQLEREQQRRRCADAVRNRRFKRSLRQIQADLRRTRAM